MLERMELLKVPNKSLQDIAEKVMKKKKKPVDFKKLWDDVCEEVRFTETDKKSKMAKFYNSMTLDSRFIQLEKNHWDLKSRQSYSKIKVNIETFEFEDDEDFDLEEIAEDVVDPYDHSSVETY